MFRNPFYAKQIFVIILSKLILFIYILPYIYFGEDSFVLIHDNLDGKFVLKKILAESDKLFSSNTIIIDQFMSVPRVSLGRELDFTLLLFYFFEPFNAFVIDQILIRLIGFYGMYLLLDRYVFYSKSKHFSSAVALMYSLLPFYPLVGLSVAGLPLISYVFLNIRGQKNNKLDWLILTLFPFYSSFVFSIFFLILIIFFIWLFDVFKKKASKQFTLAIFSFSILCLLVNYRLLDLFIFGFGEDFITHRADFKSSGNGNGIIRSILISAHHFLFGHYHASSLHILFVPVVSFVFLLNLISKKRDRLLILLFILNIVLSLYFGFVGSELFKPVFQAFKQILPMNIKRFHILTPLIWFMLFGLSIRYLILNYNIKKTKLIIWPFIFFTVIYMFYKSDFVNEYQRNNITYKEFFSEELFKNVKEFIGKNQETYKVASIGIHPSIALYNGFYTVDGYVSLYDEKYKHQFRQIISKELDKKVAMKNYFDNWGSRVYIFTAEADGGGPKKKNKTYPINVHLNTSVLYNMGGRYIFSSYQIKNNKENNLELLNIFNHTQSAWKIYLYEINKT